MRKFLLTPFEVEANQVAQGQRRCGRLLVACLYLALPVSAQTAYEAEIDAGLEHAEKMHHEEALVHWNRAIALRPDSAIAFAKRCQSYYELGDEKRAKPDCDKAIQLDPGNALAYRFRGTIAAARKEGEKCLADLNRSIALDSRDPYAYAHRAICHEVDSNLSRALKDYSRALAILPGDPYLLVLRANVERQMEQYEAAIEDIELALRRAPRLAGAYQHLGLVRRAMGDEAAAKRAFEKAEELTRQ